MRSVFTALVMVTMVWRIGAQSDEQLFVGWNHLFQIGVDLNSVIQVNPKFGQEGSNFRWGFNFSMHNIFLEQGHILENRFNMEIAAIKNESEAFIHPESGELVNPVKKNYDQIRWRTKYAKEIRDERHYLAAEHFLYTSLTGSYEGNYFKSVDENSRKLSAFLSPMTSTLSVGYERRNPTSYTLYLSPLALKTLWVADREVASLPALNVFRDSVQFLGSGIHGNSLTYDEESGIVEDVRQARLFMGAQILFNYDREIIVDKLIVANETRIFFDYLDRPTLDINLNLEVSLVILKGLRLTLISELIKDDNLFFQSAQRQTLRDVENRILRKGTSYSQRLALRYAFEK